MKIFLPILLVFLSITFSFSQPMPCGEVSEMTSTCESACVVCDIDGFTGVNDLSIQGQTFPGFCTTLHHNMSYIAFIAGSIDLSISVTVTNCTNTGMWRGLEIGFFESPDCNTFIPVTDCNTDVAPNSTVTFSNDVPLTIGQHYYLIMDGSAGDICDWTFNVISGTTAVPPLNSSGAINGPSVTCADFPTTYTVEGADTGTSLFFWSIDGVQQAPTTQIADITFTTPGTAELCVIAANACDEAPQICNTIVVAPAVETLNIEERLCPGECIEAGGQTFCETGIFQVIVPTALGCDSTINIDLEIVQPSPLSINTQLCPNDCLEAGGQTFCETGSYSVTVQTALGCDSTININLEIVQPDTLNIDTALCIGTCLDVGNETLCETGTYEVITQTGLGCDSVINVILEIIKPDTLNLNERICFGDCFVAAGASICQTGTYELVATTVDGCDSIINLQLEVVITDTLNLDEMICANECLEVGGQSLCTPGEYQIVTTTPLGCDSFINVVLSTLPDSESFVDINLCNGESFFIGPTPYTQTGIFIDTVSNSVGCDSVVNLDLFIIECEIIGSTDFIPPICHGDATGFLIFSVENGTPPFNYDWRNIVDESIGGIGSTILFENNQIANVPVGTYEININDNFGNDVVLFQTVTEPPTLSVSLTAADINGFNLSCNGGDDGSIMANGSGGIPPYSYEWSNGFTQQNIDNLSAGTYTVNITDNVGCIKISDPINLNEPDPLNAFVSFNNPSCDGFETGFIQLDSINGGTSPYLYSLTNNDYGDTIFYDNLGPNNYSFNILDGNDCTTSVEGELTAPDIPLIVFPENLTINLGDSIRMNPTTRFDELIDISWTEGSSLSCDDCLNPFAKPFNTTVYTLSITSADSCTTTSMVTVFVNKIRDVHIPNAFSPNDDGNNDRFFVNAGPAVTKVLSLKVFSRWGETIYAVDNIFPNDPSTGWDGTFKGRNVATGVYVWVAEIAYLDGIQILYSGDISVIK